MSEYVKKSVSILLSGLLLLSTCGFSIDQHFCQGKLINTRFFSSAPSCSGKGMKACRAHPRGSTSATGPNYRRPPCCQNTGAYVHVDVNVKSAPQVTSLAGIASPAVLAEPGRQISNPLFGSEMVVMIRWMHPPPLLRSHRHWTCTYRC